MIILYIWTNDTDMKCMVALIVFFLTATVYSKDIPTPFWYSITQKIIFEAQDYIIHEPFSSNQVKAKLLQRTESLNSSLQCDQRKDLIQMPFIILKSNPIWNKMN